MPDSSPVIRSRHAPQRQPLRVAVALLGALLTAGFLVLSSRAATPAPAAAPAAKLPAAKPAATRPADAKSPSAEARAAVAKRVPGVKPEDVRLSVVPGVFEVSRGAEIFYVTADARYVFAGDLYDLDQEENLSDERRRTARAALMSTVPESQMLVFSPKDPKYTVTVFTDIDCGFCRKLHNEMSKYNELGIRVRYMFYPRTGPNTESWDKANAVWCSQNRNDALTRAKRGEDVKAAKCGQTPVERDYEIGRDMAVTGTPAIVLPNGEMVQGYRAAPALLKILQAQVR
jgi:thiol:disulfide interchange protein DsbC